MDLKTSPEDEPVNDNNFYRIAKKQFSQEIGGIGARIFKGEGSGIIFCWEVFLLCPTGGVVRV